MTKYKRYRKTQTLTMQGHQMKRSIAHNRSRAIFVGVLYLIGTILLAAVAAILPKLADILPTLMPDLSSSVLPGFLTSLENTDTTTLEGKIGFINGVLFLLMLIGMVVNVIKALCKLAWLCKKSATEDLGLNRNVYAMQDMGRAFSGSLALLFSTCFLMCVICGDGAHAFNGVMGALAGGEGYNSEIMILSTVIVASLIVFVIVHSIVRFLGAKVSYFNIEKGQIVEHKRIVGRIAPIVRNAIQLIGVALLMAYFLQVNTIHDAISTLLVEGGVETFMADQNAIMAAILQVVILVSLFVLIKHATATTEYAINGVRSSGMKNFRVFAFFVFVAAAVSAFLVQYDAIEAFQADNIILAVVALVLFVAELIMRKLPKFPEEKRVKGIEYYSNESEFTLDSLPQFTHPFDEN